MDLEQEKVAAESDETAVEAPAEMSGAAIIVESLIRNGAEVAFGFPGGTVIPLYDELLNQQHRFRHILVRHEQGAIHAAQAYARVTGRPGLAFGTSGPGAANLITGIMDAHLDSTPVVVIGGQVPTSFIGNDAFQECDMMVMTNPITKHNFQPRSADELALVVDQAFHIAASGRPGPVYIDLPKDIQMEMSSKLVPGPLDLPHYVDSRPVDPKAMMNAVEMIRDAKRPLMILGQGAMMSGASDILQALAHDLQIPVGTTILAKGAMDERDPLSVGCFGMHGRRVANYTVSHCDVMIVFGCRFSDRVTGETKSFAEGKKIIHVEIDPYEIDKNVPAAIGLNCDALEAAKQLKNELQGFKGDWENWSHKIENYVRLCNACLPDPPNKNIHPKELMDALNEVVADEDIVTTGVGQHQMFASHYLYRRLPRTFLTSGGSGTMGFGLPSAIGAAVAKPEVCVWNVDGDGSFQMTLQELGTLAACKAKVNIVIMDNGYLGMVRQWQELFHDRRYSAVELSNNPNFVKLAESYGIEGIFAEDADALKKALAYAKTSENSVLIHVPVVKESNIMPMIPPGGKVTDFIGHCIKEPGNFFREDETS